MPRPKVFVSYSHKDKKALEQLRRFLHPLEREGLLATWADTGLQGGDDWKHEIDQALAEATVAVLLISQDFLASDFIVQEEIPRILQREAEGKLKILPVFLSPSAVEESSYPDPRTGGRTRLVLSRFEGFGQPDATLAALKAAQREQVYADLARRLRGFAGAAPPPLPPPAPAPRPAPDPARAYELTVALETRGDKLFLSYHLPGLERTASDTVSWSEVERAISPIQESLDRVSRHVLLPQLEDPNGWGKALFDVLFPKEDIWEPVFRTLFGRPSGPRPNPSLLPVRLRIHAEDHRLSGLPWRITSWARQPLVDTGWTFTTTHTLDPILDLLTTAPCNVLAVVHDPDHARAVLDALKNVWPTGRDPGYFEAAGSRAELENALRVHRPHLLYVYGSGCVESGRPCLVLDRGERLSLADLRQMFRSAGHAPAVVYLNTEGLTTAVSATPDQIFGDAVPLLFWRRQPEPSADAPTTALLWLRHWLAQGKDPIGAFHAVHQETCRSSSEAGTVAVHSSYRAWRTEIFQGAATAPSHPALQIDRDLPKALVQKHLEELVRSGERRVMAIVPYALPGNSLAMFWEQLQHHLDLSLSHLADIRWVRLQIPPGRANLRRDLEDELKLQLGAEPNELPRNLLRRWGPKAVGRGRRPVLWLNWGTFGEAHEPLLTDDQLAGWLRFASEFLGLHCPDDLRIVAYAAQEVPEALYKSLARKLRELRQDPLCFTPVFRLSDGVPLEEVDELHLLEFLADRKNSGCDPEIRREVAERIIAKTGGAFAPTVALVEEAEGSSWYDLLARLRQEQD